MPELTPTSFNRDLPLWRVMEGITSRGCDLSGPFGFREDEAAHSIILYSVPREPADLVDARLRQALAGVKTDLEMLKNSVERLENTIGKDSDK